MTLREALRSAQQRIDRVDARVLLGHVTHRDAAYVIAHAETPLEADLERAYTALVARRAAGEPVAYLVGEREFFGRRFTVTPATLIPRPETEHLVGVALERIPGDADCAVLDLGTGSGCIAVTLALERPQARVTAVDNAPQALEVARANAARLGATTVKLFRSDWYSALGEAPFDVIVSNPPYVASGDPHLARGDLRYEPPGALAGGGDGLECIRLIVAGAPRYLAAGGWLVIEHGYDQAARTRALLAEAGFEGVFSTNDLAGIERVSGARLTLADPSR